MDKFRYCVGELQFSLPWARPDLYRLRLWYADLCRELEFRDQFDLYLFGGGWAGNSASWEYDLFLVPTDNQFGSSPRIDPNDIHRNQQASQIIRRGYELAIRKHRLLIDFFYSNLSRLWNVYRQYQAYERGEVQEVYDSNDSSGCFQVYQRIEKWRNGRKELERAHSTSSELRAGNQLCLFEKTPGGRLLRQQGYIDQGRVYLPPQRVVEIID